MNRLMTGLVALGSLAAAGLSAGPALALPDTVFVDPNIGLDTNLCTETSPCLTLAHAATQVTDPGTIVILSSGSLAPVSITTNLAITCPSRACIIDGSGHYYGIQISAPGKTVNLTGVALEGYGAGVAGILVYDVDRLALDDVSISDFSYGIYFIPSTGADSHLFVQDSEISNSITRSVVLAPNSSNAVSAAFSRTRIHHSLAGIVADAVAGTGGVSVTFSDGVISFQTNNGVIADGNAAGAVASVLIDNSAITYSAGNCVMANGATAQVALTKTMVTQCNVALNPLSGGQIFTYGDNAVNFSTSNGTAPTTAGGFE
jgi:hypothetical protein